MVGGGGGIAIFKYKMAIANKLSVGPLNILKVAKVYLC